MRIVADSASEPVVYRGDTIPGPEFEFRA